MPGCVDLNDPTVYDAVFTSRDRFAGFLQGCSSKTDCSFDGISEIYGRKNELRYECINVPEMLPRILVNGLEFGASLAEAGRGKLTNETLQYANKFYANSTTALMGTLDPEQCELVQLPVHLPSMVCGCKRSFDLLGPDCSSIGTRGFILLVFHIISTIGYLIMAAFVSLRMFRAAKLRAHQRKTVWTTQRAISCVASIAGLVACIDQEALHIMLATDITQRMKTVSSIPMEHARFFIDFQLIIFCAVLATLLEGIKLIDAVPIEESKKRSGNRTDSAKHMSQSKRIDLQSIISILKLARRVVWTYLSLIVLTIAIIVAIFGNASHEYVVLLLFGVILLNNAIFYFPPRAINRIVLKYIGSATENTSTRRAMNRINYQSSRVLYWNSLILLMLLLFQLAEIFLPNYNQFIQSLMFGSGAIMPSWIILGWANSEIREARTIAASTTMNQTVEIDESSVGTLGTSEV